MTSSKPLPWDRRWDAAIRHVIRKAGLVRALGSSAEARQFLSVIILDQMQAFQAAPEGLRRVVLYRRAVDELRRQQVKQRHSCEVPTCADGSLDWAEALVDLGGDARPTPESIALANDVIRLVEQEIPMRDRQILYDHFCRDMSQPEIGRKYGIAHQRVSQIIQRSLDSIRRKV